MCFKSYFEDYKANHNAPEGGGGYSKGINAIVILAFNINPTYKIVGKP